MRAFGRDLIRGGHYGQRSCEPHLKAEHMAAPTNAAYVKKALANSEPSTHGTFLPCRPRRAMSVIRGTRRHMLNASSSHFDPERTQTGLAGCKIAPIPPDGASPIRYLTIRVWLAGIECTSIN